MNNTKKEGLSAQGATTQKGNQNLKVNQTSKENVTEIINLSPIVKDEKHFKTMQDKLNDIEKLQILKTNLESFQNAKTLLEKMSVNKSDDFNLSLNIGTIHFSTKRNHLAQTCVIVLLDNVNVNIKSIEQSISELLND